MSSLYNLDVSRASITALLRNFYNEIKEADDHFFAGIVNEYQYFKSISSVYLSESNAICSAMEPVVNQILREFAILTGQSFTPLDWTVAEWASGKSCYGPDVLAKNNIITQILTDIKGLYDNAPNQDAREEVSLALPYVYAEISLWLESFGPNFPAVHTEFTPVATAVKVTAEALTDQLKLTLIDNTGDPVSWAVGGAWGQLTVGDTVYIEKLNIVTPSFAAFVEVPYVIASLTDPTELILDVPGTVAATPATTSTEVATLPRSNFVLRVTKKLVGA